MPAQRLSLAAPSAAAAAAPALLLIRFFLAGVVLLDPARADVRDWVSPHHVPNIDTCPGGCAPWTNVSTDPVEQTRIDSFWSSAEAQRSAGSRCAMPAASAGYDLGDGRYIDHIFNSLAGPWCYCVDPIDTVPRLQYCIPDPARPAAVEQLNLQVAAPDVVVASFVTRDTLHTAQTSPPVGQIGSSRADAEKNPVGGISHFYPALSTAEGSNYTLHFIKFGGLVPGQTDTYRVKSGNKDESRAEWSTWHEFRAPRAADQGPTRIGIYGDMGHSQHNPMQNLVDYCHRGDIDTIVHMGDRECTLRLQYFLPETCFLPPQIQ